MTVATDDFIAAVQSVEAEKECPITIDRVLARNLIEEVYRRRTGGETGKAFHALFQQAVEHFHVHTEQQHWYRCVTGRYFNPRAVRAKQRSTAGEHPHKEDVRLFPRILGAPTSLCVTIEVFEGASIIFSTIRLSGQLVWNDVCYGDLHPATSPGELYQAHKIALEVLNSRRHY